jgi:hypothetical protein
MLRQLALVSETSAVKFRDVARVSAALQKQAVRDFGPIWKVSASVDVFEQLEDVPIGYWPMIIRDDIGFPGAAGIHLDRDGQPFALIQTSEEWSLTASHECLEMLADPFGNRLVAGPAPKEAKGQKRVEYLVEVCDPSEAARFGYTVNGILMSDFYTPRYFDPVTAAGVRYSFTGAIKKPRQVLKGGYVSWHDPVSDHWFQIQFFGPKAVLADLGVLARNGRSLREMIDEMTPTSVTVPKAPPANRLMAAAAAGSATVSTVTSTASRAKTLREQIQAIIARG